MSRYKHTLYVSRPSTGATLNEDGDLVAQTEEQVMIGLCRAEPSSARNTLVVDGQQVVYGWKIYMQELSAPINVGEQILVKDQHQAIRAKGTVIHIVRDDKNVKLWL